LLIEKESVVVGMQLERLKKEWMDVRWIAPAETGEGGILGKCWRVFASSKFKDQHVPQSTRVQEFIIISLLSLPKFPFHPMI